MKLSNQNIISEVKLLIAQAQQKAVKAINHERTILYWNIGKRIFEEEQDGKEKANYGGYLIQSLAENLEPQFGSGFGKRQLELMRQFYRTFPITNALRSQLSWTHYRLLMRIDNEDKRTYYLEESSNNLWTTRQLERQINSQLYERLLLSNDKDKVLSVAKKEAQPTEPSEIIKDPMVLEFLGLEQKSAYYEKDLETAIITHLQEFLMEMGNGFTFVARQKRIHLDGDDFFVDLILYNRLLQCFVIIELKTEKLNHSHIGQLQMYVNYYDRQEKQEHENSTIGILLCADKNDAVVKFTLPKNEKNILASKYQLYLPKENELIAEMKKELKAFKREAE